MIERLLQTGNPLPLNFKGILVIEHSRSDAKGYTVCIHFKKATVKS